MAVLATSTRAKSASFNEPVRAMTTAREPRRALKRVRMFARRISPTVRLDRSTV